MDIYEPPFKITNRIIGYVGSISEKVGCCNTCRNIETKPHLRRNNRIKSVHSSLKIEANSLSEGSVRAVLDNRLVIGPQKEIQEVKNAFAAYELLPDTDPYSVDELKKLHGVMTYLTVEESGEFRKGAEGVFDGERCIFMAPPPEMVPELMCGLFAWMSKNRNIIHPLILSSVFHYEFVFIHPFGDGNGRMARLWQTLLLSSWEPVFRYIPIESQIEKFQNEYYAAIARCSAAGDSTAFIEFMLARIDEVLAEVLRGSAADEDLTPYTKKLLSVMEYDTAYSANELLGLLGLSSKEALRRNYIAPALSYGLIEMTVPDKPTSRNQRYRKK